MLRYVDHAIIGVADLAAAARDYEALLGVAVSPGGTHPGAGTHNRLVVLDPAYIELIARLPGADPEAALVSPVAPMLARLPGPNRLRPRFRRSGGRRRGGAGARRRGRRPLRGAPRRAGRLRARLAGRLGRG